MGLLDGTSEDPRARVRRYIIMISAAVVLTASFSYWLYFLFLHVPERRAADHFFEALIAGDTQHAYELWKPKPGHYPMNEFLEDWGPKGFYGPVKSFRIEDALRPRDGSGVIVIAEISPDQPFPSKNDIEKASHTKEVRIWVETRDKSISFPPNP